MLAGIVTLVALVIRFGTSYANNTKEYDRSIAEQGIFGFYVPNYPNQIFNS